MTEAIGLSMCRCCEWRSGARVIMFPDLDKQDEVGFESNTSAHRQTTSLRIVRTAFIRAPQIVVVCI